MSRELAFESEASLIRGVLDRRNDHETSPWLTALEPEAFVTEEHRAIWKAFQTLQDGLIDSWVVTKALKKMGASHSTMNAIQGYFADAHTSTGTADLKYRVNAVAEAYKRRLIAHAMQRMAEKAYTEDLKTLDADFQEVAGKLSRAGNAQLREATDYARQFEAYLSGAPILPPESRENLAVFGVHGIDSRLVANPGRLLVIGGLPSAGKTALAIQACVRTAQSGHRVAMGSLEMDEDEISARIVACACGVNSLGALRSGNRHVAPEDPPILEGIRRNLVGVHGYSGDSWTSLESAITREHRRSPLSLVVVDYLQLLEAPELKGRRDSTEASRIGEITKSAKRMAQKLGCNVLMLSQFNRDVAEGQEPTLQNFLGSGQIERDIDIALLMWNTTKNPDPEQAERSVMCRVAKNRGGERYGLVNLAFHPAHNQFREVQKETAPRYETRGYEVGA